MTSAALIIWPFIGLLFFRTLGFQAAIAATIIGGYLLLPTRGGFDLPMLPGVNKDFVASVTAVVFAMIFARRSGADSRPGWLPLSPIIVGLLLLLVVGAFGTALTNADPAPTGGRPIPGLRPYDGASIAMNSIVAVLPFLLARKYFATPESHRTLLTVLVVAGVGYSLLALFEVRMSPQLNTWIYGYFQHEWRQHLRDGGFRPIVFLTHALWLAIFLSCTALAAFGLWRIGGTRWRPWFLAAALWILMTVVLCKSFGAIAITVMMIPLILVLPFRMQILAAAVVATILTVYPVLRSNDLVPTTWVVETVAKIQPGREGSLEYRLRNEDILLEKAEQRPLFGWGGWGRGRVYENGRDISVTDGYWIIVFSEGGWVRYVALLGLMTYSIFALAVRSRRYELAPATAVLSIVLAANLIDLVPNATATSVTFLLAGALAGRLELARGQAGEPEAQRAAVSDGPAPGGRMPPRAEGRAAPAAAVSRAPAGGAARPSPFTRFVPKPGRNA